MMLVIERIPPPPAPWTASCKMYQEAGANVTPDNILRAAMSQFMVCAAPHRALPRANKARELSIVIRRPKIFIPVRNG